MKLTSSTFWSGHRPLWLIFFISLAVSFFYAQAPMMGDDIDYYGFALHRHMPRVEFPVDEGFHFLRWPVWGLIWLYQWVGGYGWFSFLFVPFFCLAVTCAIAFYVGRESSGLSLGRLAALLVFFHPLVDPLIARPMPDVVECALGGLGFLVIWRFLFTAKKHSVFSVVSYGIILGGLIFVTWANRPTGLIWVIAVGLLSLFHWRQVWFLWVSAFFTFVLCFSIEGWIYHTLFGDFWHSWHANLKATGRKGTETMNFWKLPFRFLDTLAFGGALKLPYFLLMLGGGWIAWRQGKKGKWIVGWIVLIYLGVACAFQSLFPLRPLVRDGARFLGSLALPAGILAALGLQALWQLIAPRFQFFSKPRLRNGVITLFVLMLFFTTSRNRWNPDYLPELKKWLGQIQANEKIRTHNNFYEIAFMANPQKAKQLNWSIFKRNQLSTFSNLLDPNPEGFNHLLLHRPRLIVSTRKALEKGERLDPSQVAQDLLSSASRWQLRDVLYRSSEVAQGGQPEFYWFNPSSTPNFSYEVTAYLNELSWQENSLEEEKKHFFEKQGSGKLIYREGEGLIFKRNAKGKVVFSLTQPMRLSDKAKGRVFDLRMKTVSEKVEPFVSQVTFLNILSQEIETQEIECFASPTGFWDFFGVKIPADAFSFQWKIAVANSCQSFALKEVRLLKE